MKRFSLLLITCIIMITANAYRGSLQPENVVPTKKNPYTFKTKGLISGYGKYFHSESLKICKPTESISRQMSTRADETTYPLTITFTSTDNYMPQLFAYAKKGSQYWTIENLSGESGFKATWNLSEGTYTIVAIYPSTEEAPIKVVIRENYEIKGNQSLELNDSEATEHVRFQPLLPDGTRIIGPLLDNETGNMIERGTVFTGNDFFGYFETSVGHEEYGQLCLTQGNFVRIQTGDKIIDIPQSGEYMFTPGVSNTFKSVQTMIHVTADAESAMLITSESNGVNSQIVNNRTQDFSVLKPDEIVTTANYCHGLNNLTPGLKFGFYSLWKGVPTQNINGEGDLFTNAKKYLYCVPTHQGETPLYETRLAVVPYFAEDYQFQTYMYQILPPLLKKEGDRIRRIITPLDKEMYLFNDFSNTPDGLDRSLLLNGNPTYSFYPEGSMQIAGDNVPMIIVSDVSSTNFGFIWANAGRLGEFVSNPDGYASELKASYGDKRWEGLWKDDMLDSWFGFWKDFNAQKKNFKGKVNLSITEEKAIQVDGIPSRASSQVVYDFSTDDYVPPMPTMLQFRNTDNKITDRFTSASEGIITFSAADMKFNMDYIFDENGDFIGFNNMYLHEGAPEVKVEYSPLHTEDWVPIEVVEVPEKFYMPAYGNFYQGSLKSVDRKAEKGWFDIRITLRDKAGNSQISTVSPAFKIEDQVGVSETLDDNSALWIVSRKAGVVGCDNAHFEIFTIDGKRIRTFEGTEISLDALSSGAYIIKASTSHGIFIRKSVI